MNLASSLEHPVFRHIGRVADEMGREVYVVGGYVRDIFLDRPSVDIDFVTVGSGIELASAVAESLGRSKHLTVYASYGTAQVRHGDLELEFVGARRESYSRESRNPIVEDGTLEDDQNRRDFTINAMAICLNEGRFGELVDPFGGIADIEARTIRTPSILTSLSPTTPQDDARDTLRNPTRIQDSSGNIPGDLAEQRPDGNHHQRTHQR